MRPHLRPGALIPYSVNRGKSRLKLDRVPADGTSMRQEVLSAPRERAHLRLRMIAHEPVYVLMTVGGGRLDLVVDDLSAGGARLKVPRIHENLFQVGQILGPSLLILSDIGLPVVHPVVKWKSDSAIGVEFLGVTEKQKEMIFKFLFKVERKTVRSLAS